MKLLQALNLRPLKYQEILFLLMKDDRLKNELKGERFWLDGSGMDKNGVFTIDEKGELSEIKKKGLSIEKKVLVRKGNQPLLLDICSDSDAAVYYRRFDLYANERPYHTPPVVVGVPNEFSETSKAVVLDTLLRRAKIQVAELKKHQKRDTIDAIEQVLSNFDPE